MLTAKEMITMKKRILALIFTLILSMGVMAFVKTADQAGEFAAADPTFLVETVEANGESDFEGNADS